jgi:hypothetical protein
VRESDIVYETGDFWVGRVKRSYTVYRNVGMVAVSDSAYSLSADGLSIAKARADYLARRVSNGGLDKR